MNALTCTDGARSSPRDRIVRIDAEPLAIPFHRPYRWSNGVQDGINVALVTVELSGGAVGYGEVALDVVDASIGYVRAFAPYFVGHPARNVAELTRRITKRARWEIHVPA